MPRFFKRYFFLLIALILFPFQEMVGFAAEDNPDPEPSRVFWTPTALHKEPGDSSVTNYDLIIWHLDHTFSDHFTLGARTTTPIGFFALGPTLKLSTEITPKTHLGFWAEGGFFTLLIFDDDGDTTRAYYYGGGPILTLGDPSKLLNFSVLAYHGGNQNGSDYILIPNIGGSIRLSRRTKLNAELMSFYHHQNAWKSWAFLYGIRIFGDRIYGDLGFVMPFAPNVGGFYKVMPLGYPLLSLGISW